MTTRHAAPTNTDRRIGLQPQRSTLIVSAIAALPVEDAVAEPALFETRPIEEEIAAAELYHETAVAAEPVAASAPTVVTIPVTIRYRNGRVPYTAKQIGTVVNGVTITPESRQRGHYLSVAFQKNRMMEFFFPHLLGREITDATDLGVTHCLREDGHIEFRHEPSGTGNHGYSPSGVTQYHFKNLRKIGIEEDMVDLGTRKIVHAEEATMRLTFSADGEPRAEVMLPASFNIRRVEGFPSSFNVRTRDASYATRTTTDIESENTPAMTTTTEAQPDLFVEPTTQPADAVELAAATEPATPAEVELPLLRSEEIMTERLGDYQFVIPPYAQRLAGDPILIQNLGRIHDLPVRMDDIHRLLLEAHMARKTAACAGTAT